MAIRSPKGVDYTSSRPELSLSREDGHNPSAQADRHFLLHESQCESEDQAPKLDQEVGELFGNCVG